MTEPISWMMIDGKMPAKLLFWVSAGAIFVLPSHALEAQKAASPWRHRGSHARDQAVVTTGMAGAEGVPAGGRGSRSPG